jgi:cell division septum initiation protein DivIVA
MSYEDLEEARAKRVVKDATQAAKEAKGKGKRGRKRKRATSEAEEATANKVKRGRKRKSTVLEAEAEEPEVEEPEPEPEPDAKIAQTSKAPSRASVMETPIAEDQNVPGPWRVPVAPVAKMW